MFQSYFRSLYRSVSYIIHVRNEVPRRKFHCASCRLSPRQPAKGPSPAIAGKYKILDDANAQVIMHTEDEIPEDRYPVLPDEFDGINLKRGVTGVFDIEDLVSLLQRENSKDIFVATVPSSYNYVDYMCVVSGRSRRHIIALSEFVRRVYKKKCHKSDHLPKIEGRDSPDWMALDLGNIALHIFSEKTRNLYDLETLWAVGPEFDEKLNKKEDHITDILANYSTYLGDLKPNEVK